MSNLTVGRLTSVDPVTHLISVTPGDTVYSPGSVVQVVQNYLWTQNSVSVPSSYTTFTNIPDLVCSITPKSANSRIYVAVRWMGEFGNEAATWNLMWNLRRNGTLVGRNPAWPTDRNTGIQISALSYRDADSSSTPESVYYDYLDSPASTSLLTYQACVETDTAMTLFTNRTVGYTSGGNEAGTSSITLWEIAQ
jgi:hypothetical protein